MTDTCCLICRDSENKADFLTRCNHHFHFSCLDLWLKKSEVCPLCRGSLTNSQLIETLLSEGDTAIKCFFENNPSNQDAQMISGCHTLMDGPASEGNLNMVKYLMSKNPICGESAVNKAAKNGFA